ncbi:MAG: VWA domain-containing protein, partial [Acidobacteriota bacterium]
MTLKLVQVYVTDPKGNPALNLEISDFILYDNGKLQEITGFEKHFLPAPDVKLEETKPSPARDTSSLLNRKFIFLFDYERNDLAGIAKSKKAALQFLETQVQPGDEIALFSYSPIKLLTLHEYLTSDHQKVRAALKKLIEIPGIPGGMESLEELGQSITGMEYTSERTDRPAGVSGDVRWFADSVRELAKAFRHIPGQKNIILFSKGFGSGVLRRDTHAHYVFMAMAKELASSNSPVFSVYTPTEMREKARVFSDGSLEYLSKLTGGKYLSDVTYESKIAGAIQNATSNYYVLGYSIASNWDGKFHEIKVEVKRPGHKVYAQSGYFNPRPFNKLSAVEKHLHLLDLALGEKAYFEQHLSFPLLALPFSDKKAANTVLISEVPVQRIREVVGDNTEFISLIFDQNKTIVEGKRVEMNWRTIQGEKVCHYSAASLAPGFYDCRLIIRNLEDGKGAVGACSVEIPERAAADLKLFPPLLLTPAQKAQYLNISGQELGAAAGILLYQI